MGFHSLGLIRSTSANLLRRISFAWQNVIGNLFYLIVTASKADTTKCIMYGGISCRPMLCFDEKPLVYCLYPVGMKDRPIRVIMRHSMSGSYLPLKTSIIFAYSSSSCYFIYLKYIYDTEGKHFLFSCA